MLLQTNSYIVPRDKRAEHSRLLRRFRQTLARIGCENFEVYEQVGANWSTGETTGRYVQIMRFRDRRHQLAVQAAERTDPQAQALIAEFCELINFPYQQQHGLFAVGFYTSTLPVAPIRQESLAPQREEAVPEEVAPSDEPSAQTGESLDASDVAVAGTAAAMDGAVGPQIAELPAGETSFQPVDLETADDAANEPAATAEPVGEGDEAVSELVLKSAEVDLIAMDGAAVEVPTPDTEEGETLVGDETVAGEGLDTIEELQPDDGVGTLDADEATEPTLVPEALDELSATDGSGEAPPEAAPPQPVEIDVTPPDVSSAWVVIQHAEPQGGEPVAPEVLGESPVALDEGLEALDVADESESIDEEPLGAQSALARAARAAAGYAVSDQSTAADEATPPEAVADSLEQAAGHAAAQPAGDPFDHLLEEQFGEDAAGEHHTASDNGNSLPDLLANDLDEAMPAELIDALDELDSAPEPEAHHATREDPIKDESRSHR